MRFIKKTASFVASFIIILALGGFIFVRNFDLNRYKGYIEEIVMRETGRQLKLNGDAQLGVSLVPTVVINDVTFSNPGWAKNPYMARLERLEVKFAVLPLLKKQIVVDKLILQQPEINLEVSADGLKNWEFATPVLKNGAEKKNSAQPQVEDASAVLAAGLIARQVELENGKVDFYDAVTSQTTEMEINDIQMRILGDDEPMSVNVDLAVDGQKIVGELEANSFESLLNQGKADFVAEIEAMNISAKLAGAVEDIFEAPRYAVEGNIYNPAGNFGAPETTLEMRIDGDINAADVQIKNLSIATNKVTGTAFVDWSKKRPSVKVNLASNVFNIGSLNRNSAVAFVPSLIAEAQALEMVPDDKVPFEYLTMADATANLNVGKLILTNDMVLNNVVVDAVLQNGVLNTNKINAGIGGGTINAKLTAVASKKQISVDLTSQNLKLQEIHKSLANAEKGSLQILTGGNLDIEAHLTASGATIRKLAENIDGQAIVIMDKSEIKTGKFDWFTNNIFGQLLSVLNIDTAKNTNMDVACAVVRADIKDGKALFPDGIVFDGSKLKVMSSGSVNLLNDKIDFTIAPAMNKLADANITQALASFVKIGGTLEKPKIGLDKKSALTTVVGSVMTGGVSLGAEVLLDGNGSPCYTALQGTKFASRFPKPTGVKATTQKAYKDVGKQTKAVVKGFEGAAKNLLGAFKGTVKKGK